MVPFLKGEYSKYGCSSERKGITLGRKVRLGFLPILKANILSFYANQFTLNTYHEFNKSYTFDNRDRDAINGILQNLR